MDVLLSEEEQMVKNLAREFLQGECPPSLARAMEQDDLGYPPDLWKQMADLGWFGMSLPEAYGGQGLPLTYLGIVLEEVGRAIAPVPFHSTMVAALAINAHGSEQQRRELLPGVASGSTILTWAFNERDPRFLPQTIQARAIADGDDFILSGTKLFVDNFNSAAKCLVVCRTGAYSEENPREGISLLLVDTNAPGVSHVPLTTLAKDKQSIVTFDQVRVPASNLVGQQDQGWELAQDMLDRGTALLCAQMVGAARKDSEMGIEYAKNRVAFGRPIGSFQSIQHLCADMTIWIDGCQLLTYRGPLENGPGLARRLGSVPGQGLLQRQMRGSGTLLPGHTRRDRLHDGVRPSPMVPARVGLDHANGNHLRAPLPNRPDVVGPTWKSQVGHGPGARPLTGNHRVIHRRRRT